MIPRHRHPVHNYPVFFPNISFRITFPFPSRRHESLNLVSCSPSSNLLSSSAVRNLLIIVGHTGYSYLCRGPQKQINDVVASKQNCITLTSKSTGGINLKTIAVFLHTTEFTENTLCVSFQTVLISSHF
jgi:hypothetical protein